MIKQTIIYKNSILLLACIFFFVSFFRLSLFISSLYLSFIPAAIGFILFSTNVLKQKQDILKVNTTTVGFLLPIIFLFIYCIFLDIFQYGLTLKGSFSFRIFAIWLLSFLPAYTIYYLLKLMDGQKVNRSVELVVKISFIVQLLIFIITFLNPSIKIFLYTTFGLNDVNLNEFNLTQRGFGLSGEINFMTPFLMIFITFLIFQKDLILKILVALLQVVNSNMAVVAVLLGFIVGKSNSIFKILIPIISIFLYMFFGEEYIQLYMPRLYEEFFVHGGSRTVEALLGKHFFLTGQLDVVSFLFGFQENVATNVGTSSNGSDMGWIIMMNYGGVVLIFLFLWFVIALSFSIFKNKLYAIVWILIALIFNTKGMILGMNGYFFLSFLFLITKQFKMNPNIVR